MTEFQRHALDKIRHIGGSIYFATNREWVDSHGQRVYVPAGDFKTEGFLGWPTIRALMDGGYLVHHKGNEYALGGAELKRAA